MRLIIVVVDYRGMTCIQVMTSIEGRIGTRVMSGIVTSIVLVVILQERKVSHPTPLFWEIQGGMCYNIVHTQWHHTMGLHDGGKQL